MKGSYINPYEVWKMKDRFWKVFAIIVLLSVILMVYFHAMSTRYAVQNASHVLDKWTGKVHRLDGTLVKKFYYNL